MKFVVLISSLFLFHVASGVKISCSFSEYPESWAILGRVTTCNVGAGADFTSPYLFVDSDGIDNSVIGVSFYQPAKIYHMPYGLLDKFPGMKALYIEKQPLNVITEEDMKQFGNYIQYIYITGCAVSYVTIDTFKHNLNMRFIRFEDNPIKYIEPGFFANLAKQPPMERVKFANCGCIDTYIYREEKYLFETPEVYSADANHTCNDLTQVQINKRYVNIECGILGYNLNSRCKFFVFDEDTLVSDVIFSGSTGNKIIKYLTLTSSVMRFIPNNFGAKFKELKHLMIDSVGLMRISKISLSAEMKSLQVLNAAKNALVNIPNDAFEYLTNLETLDLSYNNIYSFDAAIVKNLFNLKHLSLSGNGLKSIVGDFVNALPKTITTVSLQNNGCIDMKYPDDGKTEIIKRIKERCTVAAECLSLVDWTWKLEINV